MMDIEQGKEFETVVELWGANRKSKISGTLSYSLLKGIILEFYVFNESPNELLKNIDKIMYGISFDIGSFTLIKGFELCKQEAYRPNSSMTLYRYFYKYMLQGLIEGLTISKIHFYMDNLNEFCHPQGWSSSDSFQSEAVTCSDLDSYRISIMKSCKFVLLKNISDALALDSSNDLENDFKGELDAFYENLINSERYKKKIRTGRKNEINYYIAIEPIKNKILEINNLHDISSSVLCFFSIITYCIFNFTKINIYVADEKNSERGINLIFSDTRDTASKKIDYHNTPVNINSIKDNFNQIYRSWDQIYNEPKNFFTNVIFEHINDNSRRDIAHALMCIASLERMSYSFYENEMTKKNKYHLLINKHATNQVKSKLKDLMPDDNVGKAISEIRSSIAHSNDKNYLVTDFLNIASLLHMVLLNTIYSQLNIDADLDKLEQNLIYFRLI